MKIRSRQPAGIHCRTWLTFAKYIVPARLSRVLDAIQSKTLVDLTHNIEVLNKSNTIQAIEKNQTTILYVITVFAFVGQLIFSIWWAITEKEPKSAAFGYVTAASLALILFLYRRRTTRNAKENTQNSDTKPVSATSAPPKA